VSEGGASQTADTAVGESVLTDADGLAAAQVSRNGVQSSDASCEFPEVRVLTHATPQQHVILWLIGVLLASLIPLLFLYFHGLDRSSPPSIFSLLGNGDLLLISLVVTIAGITELVLAMRNIRQSQLMAGGIAVLGGVLAIAAEALWYADISAQMLDGQPVAAVHAVTVGSLLFFSLSALSSAVCVWLAAGTI
jgi:hypothetical protein